MEEKEYQAYQKLRLSLIHYLNGLDFDPMMMSSILICTAAQILQECSKQIGFKETCNKSWQEICNEFTSAVIKGYTLEEEKENA